MELTLNFCRCGFKLLKQRYKPGIRLYSEKIVPLDESTVIGRIVLFMNSKYIEPNTNSKINYELKDAAKYSINNVIDKFKSNQENHISNLKFDDIEELLRSLKYENYMSNKYHFKRLMQIIDTECCTRLDYLDSTTILRILNEFTQSVPNRIREYEFYSKAIDRLMSEVDFLSKEELLQTIFYIGLEKKSKNAQVMLRKCIQKLTKEDIESLSVEELCIICNSTFKTSTKIRNKQILESVKKTINDKLYLLKDTALFIILVKTLRHNRYQDEDLLNTITSAIFFNKTHQFYSFSVISHILALYADYLYYDGDLLNLFVDLGLRQLKDTRIDDEDGNVRVKDIRRFLWALSTLGYKNIDKDIISNLIAPNMLERIKAGQYEKDIEELINSFLYLWILDYQPIELIPYTLIEANIEAVREIKSRTKQRLNLLLTCIFFENKKLFRELNLKAQRCQFLNTNQQLVRRPNLVKVLNTLKQMAKEEPVMAVNKFEISYEIPHLPICGIIGYTKRVYKTVFVEVLDDYVCVKNYNNMPNGPMQLKLRILREMDNALITVPGQLVEELPRGELRDYLKSEIELLC